MSSPATVAAVMAGNDARAAIMWAVFGIPILQNIYFVYNSDSLSYDRVGFLLVLSRGADEVSVVSNAPFALQEELEALRAAAGCPKHSIKHT